MNTSPDYSSLLTDFPEVKLSYEIFSHKKVTNADIVIAIPRGIKCYAWFIRHNAKCVCLLLELNNEGQIINVRECPSCFSSTVATNTVFYGTLYEYNKQTFFTVEDLLYYQDMNFQYRNFLCKLECLTNIFHNEIRQVSYGKKFCVFGLPVMHTNMTQICNMITPEQKISHFQFRFFRKNNIYKVKPHVFWRKEPLTLEQCQTTTNMPIQDERGTDSQVINTRKKIKLQTYDAIEKKQMQIRKCVFNVTPDIQNDIYHLYDKNGKEVDIAYIPDYTTSVMMNKLFRNIKENNDLDALEASDDEDEFEDMRQDKYVFLDRSYLMTCSFHQRFKKWVPLEICDSF